MNHSEEMFLLHNTDSEFRRRRERREEAERRVWLRDAETFGGKTAPGLRTPDGYVVEETVEDAAMNLMAETPEGAAILAEADRLDKRLSRRRRVEIVYSTHPHLYEAYSQSTIVGARARPVETTVDPRRLKDEIVSLRAGTSRDRQDLASQGRDVTGAQGPDAELRRRAKELRAKNPSLSEERAQFEILKMDPGLRERINGVPLQTTINYPATPYKGRKGDDRA